MNKNIDIICPICSKIKVINCDDLECKQCQYFLGENDYCPEKLCSCNLGDIMLQLAIDKIELEIDLDTALNKINELGKYELYAEDWNGSKYQKLYYNLKE